VVDRTEPRSPGGKNPTTARGAAGSSMKPEIDVIDAEININSDGSNVDEGGQHRCWGRHQRYRRRQQR